MRWINVKKEELVGLECINPKNDRHILRLSPNSKNMIQDEQNNNNTRIVSIIVNNKPTLIDIKNYLLSLQKEYDSSIEVNCFILNDKKVWFDKATRVGLINSINVKKKQKAAYIELWFGNKKLNVDITYAEEFLNKLELYAMECFNITKKHIIEISTFENIEDLLNFDITAEYPKQIEFDITKIISDGDIK